jgi:hypothetical protein
MLTPNMKGNLNFALAGIDNIIDNIDEIIFDTDDENLIDELMDSMSYIRSAADILHRIRKDGL